MNTPKPQIFNVDKEMAWYAAGTVKSTSSNLTTVKVTKLKPKRR